MFDGILQGRAQVRTRALGGTLSVAVHGAILAAAVWAGTRHAATVATQPPMGPAVLFRALPGPRPLPPAAPAPAPAARPRPHPAPRHLAIPREKPTQKPPEATPAPTPDVDEGPDAPTGDALPGGLAGATGPGVPGGVPGGGPAAAAEEPTYVLGEGMTAPRLMPDASEPFRWTRAQLDARVEGLCLAQCTLTSAGALHDCKLLKRIPGVEDAQIFAYLAGLRFTPALQGGKPVSLRSYTVPLRLKVP